MNIHQATRSYENWMRSCTPVIETHLRLKHKQMRKSPFLFFRGTFYRWAQLWPELCANLRDAPKVLAVGDLHVGSFGTWRDTEGRLSWGIDDFDESYPLPYTNDLVRGNFSTTWIYLVGPAIGALIGVIFEWILKGRPSAAGAIAAQGAQGGDDSTNA